MKNKVTDAGNNLVGLHTTQQEKLGTSPSGETPYPLQPTMLGPTGNNPLTFVAVTEHIHVVEGMGEIRPTDPLLPFVVWLAEEQLAVDVTYPVAVPPMGWTEDDGYACFVEVPPSDPRHPGTDRTWMPHGGLTLRERAVVNVWAKFQYSVSLLHGLSQYLPLILSEDLPDGTLQYSEDDLIAVMRALGWAGEYEENTPFDRSLNETWAITHWAFNESDYWPSRLKTVGDFIRAFPRLAEQYNKDYDKVPEGKKPHDIGIGRPERP